VSSLVFVNQYGSTPETGFGGRYYYLARELTSHNEVMLITVANHHLLRIAPEFNGLVFNEVCEGVKVKWVKLLPYSSARSPVRVLNWFIFTALIPILLMFHRYDCIHFSSPSPVGFLGAWLSARLKSAKVVFDVRDVWPETLTSIGGFRKSHVLVQVLAWIERFAYVRSDCITSNLPNFDIRLSELGIPESKFVWIPNGVSLDEADEAQHKSTFSFPSAITNKRIVCYTGTLGEANALHVMIDAAVVLKERIDIVFVFVGDGKLRRSLEKSAKSYELQNCFFIGSLPKCDIYRVQSLADVLCVGALPSPLYRYGVAANKLYEYIYSNTPVVYYVDTPNYSPVEDAGCGIQVLEADGKSLANSITDILDNPQKYSNGTGKKYISDLHSYKRIASKLGNLGIRLNLL